MSKRSTIIAVCLNPAVDRTIETPGLRLGGHQQGRELLRVPGGKAVNVCRVLTALNTPCTLTGFLGTDSRPLFQPLLDEPLVTDAFIDLPGWTRENITLVDPLRRQETHIRSPGLPVPPAAVHRLMDRLEHLAAPTAIVAFSGSLPPGVTPETFAEMVDLCIAHGARVAVDTSGEALRQMAGRPLWLLKPNTAELAELVDRPLEALDQQLAAAAQVARHVRIVLLTRGAQGACLLSDTLRLQASVPLPPDRVVNTVGCGDALLGAFLASIAAGKDPASADALASALADGVAAAAASACRIASADFTAEDFAALRPQVRTGDLPLVLDESVHPPRDLSRFGTMDPLTDYKITPPPRPEP